MNKKDKTNVMRLLEQKGIDYQALKQPVENHHDNIFKTLVTISSSKKHYVFLVPVDKHLDLKKAAKAVGEKAIEMIKEKELLPLTGYVHGGCSPIGMKKQFITTLDQQATNHPQIIFSAGKIGWSVALKITDLDRIVPYKVADIVRD